MRIYVLAWYSTIRSCRSFRLSPCCPRQSFRPLCLLRSGLHVGLGLGVSPAEAELGRDTSHAVGRVDVLDQGELEDSGTTLAGDDGRIGKEELPDLRDN